MRQAGARDRPRREIVGGEDLQRAVHLRATHHLTNLDQSLTYRALGAAMTSAGHPVTPTSYAEFRAAVVDAPGSPLRPLGAYFPEGGFGLHMGPWPCAATQKRLAELQVVCPAVDARLIAVYLAGLRRLDAG